MSTDLHNGNSFKSAKLNWPMLDLNNVRSGFALGELAFLHRSLIPRQSGKPTALGLHMGKQRLATSIRAHLNTKRPSEHNEVL